MKPVYLKYFAVLFIAILVFGCSGEENPVEPKPEPVIPEAAFTVQGDLLPGATLSFVNSSKNADEYNWSFGDGTTSTEENPKKAFNKYGNYNVFLIATNSKDKTSDTLSQNIEIKKIMPEAGFSYSGEMKSQSVISFQNESAKADSYKWDFGDGTTSEVENPNKTYEHYGVYEVKLIAYNNQNDSQDEITKEIEVSPSSFAIVGFQLDSFPQVTSSGSGWDLTSAADVFFEMKSNQRNVVSSVAQDLAPSKLPIQWYPESSMVLENWDEVFTIYVYDEDATGDDLIAQTKSFTVKDFKDIENSYYPPIVKLSNIENTLNFSLLVSWDGL